MGIQQAKIVFVGDGAVGKTALTQTLTTGEFNASYKMTIGTNIAVYKTEQKGEKIQLILWDLGGQPRFSSVREQFYIGAKIVLFVYDVSAKKSFENLSNWIKEVDKACKTPYTGILVGNKIDLDEFRVIKFEEAKLFAETRNFQYLETSAKEEIGISELVEKLIDNVMGRSSQSLMKQVEIMS